MDFLYRHTAKFILAIVLISGVAVLLFAYDLQRTLRTNQPMPHRVVPEDVKDDSQEVPGIKTKDHYELIAKRNIFVFPEGTKLKGQTEGSGGQDVVESNLEVQLRGTVVSPGGFEMAMIEDWAQRKEELYSVGDSIQDAEIVEISKDRVVVERDGKQETLTLFTEKQGRGPMVPPPERGRVARPAAMPRPDERMAPGASSPGYLQRQQKIRSLMAQLRLRPHFQEGKPAGFIVGQVQSGSVFEEAGLSKGDIIVGVNDEAVITPNQLLQAYRLVAEDEMLWMDIIRDGEEGGIIEIDLEEIVPGE